MTAAAIPLTTLLAAPAVPPAPVSGVPAVDFSVLFGAALEAPRPEEATDFDSATGAGCPAEGWDGEEPVTAAEAPTEAPHRLMARFPATRGAGFAVTPEKDEAPGEPESADLPAPFVGVTVYPVTAYGVRDDVEVEDGDKAGPGSHDGLVGTGAVLFATPSPLPADAPTPERLEYQLTSQQNPGPAVFPQGEAEPAERPDPGVPAVSSPDPRPLPAREPAPEAAEMAFALRMILRPSPEAGRAPSGETGPDATASPLPVDAPPATPALDPARDQAPPLASVNRRSVSVGAQPTVAPARPAGGVIVAAARPDDGAEAPVPPPEAASARGEAHGTKRVTLITATETDIGVPSDAAEGAAHPSGPPNRSPYGVIGMPVAEARGHEHGQPTPGRSGPADLPDPTPTARVVSTRSGISEGAHGLPKPSAPREIALRVSESGRPPVDVRLQDRGGELRVTVHTRDAELATSMRTELPELVSSLERRGFQAETWRPPAAESPGPAAVRDSRGPGFDLSEGSSRDGQAGGESRNGGEQRQQQHRRQNARPESGFVFAPYSTEEEPSK